MYTRTLKTQRAFAADRHRTERRQDVEIADLIGSAAANDVYNAGQTPFLKRLSGEEDGA
jgi:hypothetical protein